MPDIILDPQPTPMPGELDIPELRELMSFAEQIARKAGERLIFGRSDVRSGFITKTSVMDVATATDQDAESIVVDSIRNAYPEDSLLGEEGSSYKGTSDRRWIIDPLDGTANFIRGWGVSAVSIGLEIAGSFTVGAVFNPFQDEMFTAATGLGAYRNGQQLLPRNEPLKLSEAFIGVGGGYSGQKRQERAAVTQQAIVNAGDVRYTGSAALDLCYVAAGQLDACFNNDLKIWDIAAGIVIANETGCLVTGPVEDSEPTPECVLTTVPSIMPEFRSLVRYALQSVHA